MTDPVTTETDLAQAVGAALAARDLSISSKNDAVDAKVETEALVEVAWGLKDSASSAAGTATSKAAEAAATAAAMTTALAGLPDSVAHEMAKVFLGRFATDPTWVGGSPPVTGGGSPPWVEGAWYIRSTDGKMRIWLTVSGTAAFRDYDASAQQAKTDAEAAATSALNSSDTAYNYANTAN